MLDGKKFLAFEFQRKGHNFCRIDYKVCFLCSTSEIGFAKKVYIFLAGS